MPHKKADPGDRRVRGLLSPRVLAEMENVTGFPPVPPDYDPDGDWTQTYRIWGNSGLFRFQSKDMGFLRIARTRSGKELEFRVEQVLVNADGIENLMSARIECRNDDLASPIRWTLETGFTDSSRCPRPELSMTLEGEVVDGRVYETCRGKRRLLDLEPPFTADWCLFDALQRCGGRRLEFAVLEGLTKPKPGHRTGVLDTALAENLAADGLRPCCIYEVGEGILPRQYWLDEADRIVLTISNATVYALDDEAEAKKEKLVAELIMGSIHHEY